VYHISCPLTNDDLTLFANTVKTSFAVISFGISTECSTILAKALQSWRNLGLKACIHYCPSVEDGKELVIKDPEGRYVPTIFHISSSQENIHASLLSLVDPANLTYRLKVNEAFPLAVHTYPRVPASPAFPLLTTAPAAVVPGRTTSVDVYIVSATNIAYTKTLELLRREIGPALDLEKIWGEHIYYEFAERSAVKTMSTMVKVPYVNHIATLTGGVGYDELARFYKYHFTNETVTPPDTEIITVSRTIGADRIIDEMIFKCTHTTEIDYFLPGIKPTGKVLELALVGVIAFRGDKLCFEHIYWDQASALVQLGLIDPTNLPVAGKEVARKVVDPYGIPSNTMMKRWAESDGLPIE